MTRLARIAALAFAGFGLLAGAACADFDRLLDAAFPPQVAGLPSNDRWVALPIGSWVTEGDVHATAMAACFSRDCATRAAIGVFRATGREARLADALLADPAKLGRWIEERDRHDPNARRRKLRTEVTSERVGDGAYSGLAIRLARQDGTHAAFGMLLGRRESGGTTLVLAIGPNRDAIARLVRAVVAAQG